MTGTLAHSATSNGSLRPALDAPRHELQTASAGRLCYYADTEAEGRPLVLIHSVNAAPSAREMRPLFDRYRGTRPVYAIDLPGFGCSDRADRPYSPTLYAEVINQFLNEIVAEAADVVAFSLSSEFVARATLQNPSAFHSLSLISPSGFGKRLPPSGPSTDRILKAVRLPLLGRSLYRALTTRVSIRYFLGLNFVGKAPDALIDYAYETSHQPGAQHAPFRFLSMKLFTPQAFGELYEPLQLPVLVLYDRDPNISFERLEELQGRPNWHLVRIQPTLGIPHWERSDETLAAIDRFWQSLGGAD